MEYRKFIADFSKEFPIQIHLGHGSTDSHRVLHRHDCLELNYMKSGKGVNIIGENHYDMKPGDIYIINSKELHYAFSDHYDLNLLVIYFDPQLIWSNNTFDYSYLKPFLDRKEYSSNLIGPDTDLGREIGSILLTIETEYQKKMPGYELVIKSHLLWTLALIYRFFTREHKMLKGSNEQQKAFERIKAAVDYIDLHFYENFNLNDIARIVFMSTTYFSSFFKKVMKMSVVDYITSLRINHSARLLKETSRSIEAICAECGFKRISYYSSTFKKLTGMSPSEYRNNVKKKAGYSRLKETTS